MKLGLVALIAGMLSFPVSAEGRSGQALIEAVQSDNRESVAALLSKKVDVNAREDDGATPLASVDPGSRPSSSQDHSHSGPVRHEPVRNEPVRRKPVALTLLRTRPDRSCDESPLTGLQNARG